MAGGYAGYNKFLDTTEVLLSLSDRKWTPKAPLPYRMYSMSGVTIDNVILMAGILHATELKCCRQGLKRTKIRRVRVRPLQLELADL